jgi:two-component system, NarL family, invasion response regulator UvrY
MQKRILIADDHTLVRTALMALLATHFGITGITEACSCNETMRKLMKTEYSHLILDMVLTDGTILEMLPNILGLYPRSNILIFSMQPPALYQRVLNHYGISHFLSKSLEEDLIVYGLGRFLNNEHPAPEQTDTKIPDNPFSLLTARELEILHYVLKGMGSNQIGNILNIKYNTVSTARTHIFEKSRTKNVAELFDLATRYKVN